MEKLETAKPENSLCLKFQQLIIRKNNNNNKKCRYILNFQRAPIKIVAHKQGKGRGQANGRFINNSYECAYKKLKNRLSAKKDKKKQRKREEISTAK